MKYNSLSHRWEVWWMDTAGEPFLYGWISAELPEDHIQYWYGRVLRRLFGP